MSFIEIRTYKFTLIIWVNNICLSEHLYKHIYGVAITNVGPGSNHQLDMQQNVTLILIFRVAPNLDGVVIQQIIANAKDVLNQNG